MRNLLHGPTVLLTPWETADVDVMSAWQDDVNGMRKHLSSPVSTRSREELLSLLQRLRDDANTFAFAIRLNDDTRRIVGEISLDGIQWTHRVTGLGVSIGTPRDRGQGYGSAAIELALEYAFEELNLHRVQLGVFSYNSRAIALYERLGFNHEGAQREWGRRDGAWFDLVNLGLLEHEWRTSRGR